MHIPTAAIERLPRYLAILDELETEGVRQVSSAILANRTGSNDILVRSDLNRFGSFGQKGIGYDVTKLKRSLLHILGADRGYSVILLAGDWPESSFWENCCFEHCVEAVFQIDPGDGTEAWTDSLRGLNEAAAYVRSNRTDIAILAVPDILAQSCAESMARSGIRGILNLTGAELDLCGSVFVQNLDLSDLLLDLVSRLDRPAAKEENSAPALPS